MPKNNGQTFNPFLCVPGANRRGYSYPCFPSRLSKYKPMKQLIYLLLALIIALVVVGMVGDKYSY